MWRETKRNIQPCARWKLKYVFLTKRMWHICQKYCFGEHEKHLGRKKQAQIFARSYSRQGFNRVSLGVSSPPPLKTPVPVSPSASSKHWGMHTDLGQHNSGFSILLCPSSPGLLFRIPDSGMVMNASLLQWKEEVSPSEPHPVDPKVLASSRLKTHPHPIPCWASGALCILQDEAPWISPWHSVLGSYADDSVPSATINSMSNGISTHREKLNAW